MHPKSDDRKSFNTHEPIAVVGAGPAGLAAAITLARARYPVVVHEAQSEVGHRFRGDIQGLENWSEPGDVIEEFATLGLSTDFAHHPCYQGFSFDAWGKRYRIRSPAPLLYLVERGPGPASLDSALLNQACALGVEVNFNSRLSHLDHQGVLATGPDKPFAIAVGYHFETEMDNGFWVICDNKVAPKGYAYLVVLNGHATLKSCLFDDFANRQVYLQRTLSAFEKLVHLRMVNPRSHGGFVNAALPLSALRQGQPIAGELAGFQDSLWGFGMRLSIRSGVLAAQSLINQENYDALWQRELEPLMKSSLFNRTLYAALGNHGYRWYLKLMQRQSDARQLLFWQYRPSRFKSALFPLLNAWRK